MNKKSSKGKGLVAGLIAFGAIFAVISLIFHPHTIGGLLLTGLASGIGGALIGVMGSGLDTTTHNKMPDSLEKVKEDTGDAEADAVLARGREMIEEIRKENSLIPDSELSDKLEQLEKNCSDIFHAVYENPGKATVIRKFMDYYLPTTLKLVKGYRTLDEHDVTSREALNAKQRISNVLGVVLDACGKMKENLYRDNVLDLTTDIDVLEQMLKRDGLTENDLEQIARKARYAAEIDRAAASGTREHIPQVPTMNGKTYSVGSNAFAEKKK